MVAVLGGILVVLALLGGLLKLTGDGEPAAAKPSGNRTAEPSSTADAGRVTPAEPTASEQATYLATLAEIDPGLTVNTTRVMRRAGRVCDYVLNGMDGAKYSLAEYTVLELSGGNATINEAQAKQVITAVKVWCRPA